MWRLVVSSGLVTDRIAGFLPLTALVLSCRAAGQSSTTSDAAATPASTLNASLASSDSPPPLAIGAQSGPVTEATVLGRLARAAAELPHDSTIPRIGLANVAYPRSQEELVAMGGFALLFITVVCWDTADLPVSRVDIHDEDGPLKLALLGHRISEMRSGAVSKAMGRARYDGVYLIPIFMTRQKATVTVSLRDPSRVLEVLRYPRPDQDDGFPAGLDYQWKPFAPSAEAVRRLIRDALPLATSIKLITESQ